MPEYFLLDTAKMSWRERWDLHPRMRTFLVSSVLQIVRSPLRMKPRVRPEAIQRLLFEELPRPAQTLLESPVRDVLACGLRLCFYYRPLPENPKNPDEMARAVVFLGADPRFWAAVLCVRVQKGKIVRDRTVFQCTTVMHDGRMLLSSNSVSQFPGPPSRILRKHAGASPAYVLRQHLRWLDTFDTKEIQDVSEEDLEDRLLVQSRRMFDYLLGRGILIPARPSEPAGPPQRP